MEKENNLVSENDHVCGKCYETIKAGTPLVYMYRDYHTPDGKKHVKYYPVHKKCAKEAQS
jgi:hypothetical protein